MSPSVGGSGVLIIGSSIAGTTVATELRRTGFAGPLRIVGAEAALPYDRPPLSKQLLQGTWDASRLALYPEDHYLGHDIELLLGRSAQALRIDEHEVDLDDSSTLCYDSLVIATGVQPRRLPGTDAIRGVFTLRTLEDAQAIKRAAVPGSRAVVIGGGFQGCELAASLRSLGCSATLVFPEQAPMERQLGESLGRVAARLHERCGVTVLANRLFAGLEVCEGSVRAVALSDGSTLPCDIVVVSVGSQPCTSWLEGSGLAVDDGVAVDEHCHAENQIYAAGDVAAWWHVRAGRRVRVEHRIHAAEQARYVARVISGHEEGPFVATPYFWSDQFDVRIQGYGLWNTRSLCTVVEGDTDERSFVATVQTGGRITGVVCWNAPKALARYRALVDEGVGSLDAAC